jgi:hypothetical protein
MVDMVPGVWIVIVNDLERYVVYRLGWWLDWKDVRSMDWDCGKSYSNQLNTGSRE